MIIPITQNYRLLARSSGQSLEITSLFGKKIAEGGCGAIVRGHDMLKPNTKKGTIIKMPLRVENNEDIVREVKIVEKIHQNEIIPGIQKPLKHMKTTFGKADAHSHLSHENDTNAHSHLSHEYDMDLFKLLYDSKIKISQQHRLQMVQEIFTGVTHLHANKITHDDIKPENTFIDIIERPTTYLSDFGGSTDHTEDPFNDPTTTPEYRPYQDKQALEKAITKKDKKACFTIGSKADVFATCSTACEILLGEEPYTGNPGKETYSLKKNLKRKLMGAGLRETTARLLIKGLRPDYQTRPDSARILASINKGFKPTTKKRTR